MAPSTDTGAAAPTGPVTAPVERRKITSAVIARGDANFSDPVELVIRSVAPLPIVTAAPKHRGETVDAGEVVLEVAGRPVIALAGGLPAYRDLTPGDIGPDVAQLEKALVAIGLDPGDVDDEFTKYTGAAVADLYERLGYEPTTAAESDPDATDEVGPSEGPIVPMSEVTFVPTLPRRVDRAPARRGRTLPEKPMLLSGSDLIVSIGLTAADRDLLHRGMRAIVDIPGEDDVRARLRSVTATATGGRTSLRLPGLSGRQQHAVQGANVKVTVPLASTKRPALVVPLAALSTDAGGTVRVVRVAAGGARHTIEVELGLSADGFVEVRADSEDLAEGDRVVVGE
jgi:hypothetical protein